MSGKALLFRRQCEEKYVKDVCKEKVTAKKNGKSHIASEEEKEDD